MPKTPEYQRRAADRWRTAQKEHGAQRVEFLLTASELAALDTLAERHGSRIAALRWLLQNALPAEPKPADIAMPVEAKPAEPKPADITIPVEAKPAEPMPVDIPIPAEPKPADSPLLPAILLDRNADMGERKAALATYARQLQAEGLTQPQIAERWNREGIPTLWRIGAPWTWKNVSNLITRHRKG